MKLSLNNLIRHSTKPAFVADVSLPCLTLTYIKTKPSKCKQKIAVNSHTGELLTVYNTRVTDNRIKKKTDTKHNQGDSSQLNCA